MKRLPLNCKPKFSINALECLVSLLPMQKSFNEAKNASDLVAQAKFMIQG